MYKHKVPYLQAIKGCMGWYSDPGRTDQIAFRALPGNQGLPLQETAPKPMPEAYVYKKGGDGVIAQKQSTDEKKALVGVNDKVVV